MTAPSFAASREGLGEEFSLEVWGLTDYPMAPKRVLGLFGEGFGPGLGVSLPGSRSLCAGLENQRSTSKIQIRPWPLKVKLGFT